MVKNIPCKHLHQNRYYLANNVIYLDEETNLIIEQARALAKLSINNEFNVIKISEFDSTVSFLEYKNFHEEAFPVLQRSWCVDCKRQVARYRTYAESINPPILHRKELLLYPDHPNYKIYCQLTADAEELGLFDEPNKIGFLRPWTQLVAQRGFKIVGHSLLPIGNDEATISGLEESEAGLVLRHLTALSRTALSAPLQALSRFGFLDGSKSVFDYGCGKGGDIKWLREQNIPSSGWDPYYANDQQKNSAQIVNLGFVINVIEDLSERVDALRSAYNLAGEVLVVSAMLANQDGISSIPYGDGVLTSRNTFQKYYTQGELRQFISETLNKDPVAVAPGIFFVFCDKESEQRFLYSRYKNKRSAARLSYISIPIKSSKLEKSNEKYFANKRILDSLWEALLSYGRPLDMCEVPNRDEIIQSFGTVSAAIRFVVSRKSDAEHLINEAKESRTNDLVVYLARNEFGNKKTFKLIERHLQRDIRYFFGDMKTATAAAHNLLFKLAEIEAIGNACHLAAENGLGYLDNSCTLQVHTSLVEQLPPLLRTYIYCGLNLYGDVSSADLIKIHIRSAKLTLMVFDDFMNNPLPKMIQRVKINLRTQELRIFDYIPPHDPPYLYWKSRYINEEFEYYSEQVEFEEQLESICDLSFDGYGPLPAEFDAMLNSKRYAVDGFVLRRSNVIPDIDSTSGRYFTYRKLIECGDTWESHRINNIPKNPESYNALLDLSENVIDPIVDYYGMIRLTYGFCSSELQKLIPGRVCAKLDQHAACELNRNGNYICDRQGAAFDFVVEDENMIEVVQWVACNLPFDRIYFVDAKRPIHVSYGPAHTRQIVRMVRGPSGRLVPRIVRESDIENMISDQSKGY